MKLNGFRIELGEIEQLAERHPAVISACALLLQSRGGGGGGSSRNRRSISVFVVLQKTLRDERGEDAGVGVRREVAGMMAKALPTYMVCMLPHRP